MKSRKELGKKIGKHLDAGRREMNRARRQAREPGQTIHRQGPRQPPERRDA
jgi:hypothetical protein